MVVGMSIYDLTVATSGVRPTAAAGHAAAVAATDGPVLSGRIGGGAGATYRKWWGREGTRPGGVGMATVRAGDAIVSSLVIVNALGDIDPGDGSLRAMPPERVLATTPDIDPTLGTNTTIGVVVTNARLDKTQCLLLAQGGHDGYARSLVPAHTAADGDAILAASTGQIEADPVHLRVMATEAVTRAIRSLI
ncbi:MAG: P1 family peptidase [Acidimicrobiales bacterium]